MSTDTSGRDPSELTDWSLDGTRTHIEFLESVRTEHILIEADVEDDETVAEQPRVPQKRFVISNKSHAVETEVILFEGGWLSLRHHRRTRPGEAQLINLRFLDPTPEIHRYVAKRTAVASAALLLLGFVSGAFAYFSMLMTTTVPAAILLLFSSGVTFAVCVYRTQKRVVFFTNNGRAPVLRLLGTLGGFRALRRVVPEITRAIQDAKRKKPVEGVDQLRSEMREHYRLRETGIIDQDICAESTQRILRCF